jgi:NADPH:quinone reductase-like Zn-dependent oxidoreductase
MKAARIHQWGPPDVISVETVSVPEPTDDIGLPETLPLTLGSEVSGVVEKIGAKTTSFAVGDEVFGATNTRFVDGYAEYAIAAARMLALKPNELSHLEAASIPVVAITAWQMLFDHAKVHEGQTVVVHGAAGNVGAYAVQLAHANRLHVIATVHGDGADYARSSGADEIIDTNSQDLQTKAFMSFAARADVVIDTVGGKMQDQLFLLAKPGGIIVSAVIQPDTQRAAEYRVKSDYLIVDVNSMQLVWLADMVRRKKIRTRVGSVLPLGEARAAHQMLAGTLRRKPGKIVLQVA